VGCEGPAYVTGVRSADLIALSPADLTAVGSADLIA
jgi:hypothetical protein